MPIKSVRSVFLHLSTPETVTEASRSFCVGFLLTPVEQVWLKIVIDKETSVWRHKWTPVHITRVTRRIQLYFPNETVTCFSSVSKSVSRQSYTQTRISFLWSNHSFVIVTSLDIMKQKTKSQIAYLCLQYRTYHPSNYCDKFYWSFLVRLINCALKLTRAKSFNSSVLFYDEMSMK